MLVFSFAGLLEAKQWALDTQKGRRNLDKWELGKIALKLKPEKEMAQAVGIGERVMGRIAQLSEDAPPSWKEALESEHCKMNSALKGTVCMFIRIGLFLWEGHAYIHTHLASVPVRRFIWIWSSGFDIIWSTTRQEESQNECENFL